MGKVGWVTVVAIVVAAVVCIGLATADSCKRNSRACFGNSQSK